MRHLSDSMSRRSLLEKSVGLSLAMLSAASLGVAAEPEPEPSPIPQGKVQLTGLKSALNAYSFHTVLPGERGSGSMTLLEVARIAAKLGFDAIDPTAYFFPGYPRVPDDATLNEFKRQIHGLGLAISGTGIRNDFVTADPAIRAEGITRAKVWIEAAARIGAPVIRVFSGAEPAGQNPVDTTAWLVDCLRQCAEYGQRYGVLVGVQNHGDFLQTADRCIEVVKAVDSPWLGLIVDTGNFKVADPYADIARVVPYAVNWQVKESPFGIGHSTPTDMRKLLEIIHAGGYRGPVPIETIKTPGQPYVPEARVAAMLAMFKQALGTT
jgi:sugar phosphate isomerase/epimerase